MTPERRADIRLMAQKGLKASESSYIRMNPVAKLVMECIGEIDKLTREREEARAACAEYNEKSALVILQAEEALLCNTGERAWKGRQALDAIYKWKENDARKQYPQKPL